MSGRADFITPKPNNRMTSRQNEEENLYLNEMQHCPVQGIQTGDIGSGGKTEGLKLQLQDLYSCLALVFPCIKDNYEITREILEFFF